MTIIEGCRSFSILFFSFFFIARFVCSFCWSMLAVVGLFFRCSFFLFHQAIQNLQCAHTHSGQFIYCMLLCCIYICLFEEEQTQNRFTCHSESVNERMKINVDEKKKRKGASLCARVQRTQIHNRMDWCLPLWIAIERVFICSYRKTKWFRLYAPNLTSTDAIVIILCAHHIFWNLYRFVCYWFIWVKYVLWFIFELQTTLWLY